MMADHGKLAAGEGEEVNARLLAETATQLVDSAERLERASRLLPPDEDLHFYSNFAEFREPVQHIDTRIQRLFSQFSSLRALSRAPSLPSDPDDLSDWLVSMQDELLEQVDSAFDLFRKERAQQGLPPPENDSFLYQNARKKRRRDISTKEAKPLPGVEGKEVSMQAERCPIPFHVWSIPRPQDKFDDPVNNSNTPFQHPRPLSDSLQNAEPNVATHPLQEELQHMIFEVLVDTVEPKQPPSLEDTPFTFVNTPSLLKDTAAKLAMEREIAVDLEHHQFRSFQGLTCLMQISTRSEDYIIDTLELRSIVGQHLYNIFASPSIQKVMHGASLDVQWLQRDFGIYVCNLFDTGQAARVLELESFGLAHLLKRFCGVTPDKRYQMADWRLRPLPVEMIKYAREDTHYLLYVGDLLKQQLASFQSKDQQESLLEVYKRSRDICLKLYEKEITTDASYLQVYGLEEKKFNPQQLAVLSGLYLWRDQVARVEDESTGYVLPNHLLLKLAEEMPEDVKKLRAMLNGRHTVVARNSATIVNIIHRMKLVPQRPITEGKLILDAGKKKPPPLFEEVAFSEDGPVAGVGVGGINNFLQVEKGVNVDAENPGLQGDQNSCSSPTQCPNVIPGNLAAASKVEKASDTVSNIVFNRATKSSLFGMQEARNKIMETQKISEATNAVDIAAGGDKALKLSSLVDAPASGVVVKRASGSSFFLKSKKINRVVPGVPETSAGVGIGSLGVSRTDTQEGTSQREDVDDLAFMLGNRTSLQIGVKGSTQSEDLVQAEAESKAERIRASFSLPFHNFDGGDSSMLEHKKAKAEQVFEQNKTADFSLQEAEDLIVLEADANEGASEIEPLTVSKGIGVGSNGVHHRLWWPDSLVTAEALLLDTVNEESCEMPSSGNSQTEFPLPLSQRFRQQREGIQIKPQFSKSSSERRQSNEHIIRSEGEMPSVTPFDYAAAKKIMGLFKGLDDTTQQVQGPSTAGSNEGSRRESTERIFDPQRRMKEFKPEGITPGKRRQVFPQSGNRTGVFK